MAPSIRPGSYVRNYGLCVYSFYQKKRKLNRNTFRDAKYFLPSTVNLTAKVFNLIWPNFEDAIIPDRPDRLPNEERLLAESNQPCFVVWNDKKVQLKAVQRWNFNQEERSVTLVWLPKALTPAKLQEHQNKMAAWKKEQKTRVPLALDLRDKWVLQASKMMGTQQRIEIGRLNAEVERTLADNRNIEDSIDFWKRKYEEAKNELEEVKKEKAEMESDYEELEKKLELAEVEGNNWEYDARVAQETLNNLIEDEDREVIRYANEVEELRSELDQLLADHELLKVSSKNKDAELTELKGNLADANENLKTLKEEREQVEMENRDLKGLLIVSESHGEKLILDLEKAQQECSASKKNFSNTEDKFVKETETLQTQVSELKSKNAEQAKRLFHFMHERAGVPPCENGRPLKRPAALIINYPRLETMKKQSVDLGRQMERDNIKKLLQDYENKNPLSTPSPSTSQEENQALLHPQTYHGIQQQNKNWGRAGQAFGPVQSYVCPALYPTQPFAIGLLILVSTTFACIHQSTVYPHRYTPSRRFPAIDIFIVLVISVFLLIHNAIMSINPQEKPGFIHPDLGLCVLEFSEEALFHDDKDHPPNEIRYFNTLAELEQSVYDTVQNNMSENPSGKKFLDYETRTIAQYTQKCYAMKKNVKKGTVERFPIRKIYKSNYHVKPTQVTMAWPKTSVKGQSLVVRKKEIAEANNYVPIAMGAEMAFRMEKSAEMIATMMNKMEVLERENETEKKGRLDAEERLRVELQEKDATIARLENQLRNMGNANPERLLADQEELVEEHIGNMVEAEVAEERMEEDDDEIQILFDSKAPENQLEPQ